MKPFLKWAGGKYRIVDRIKEVLPKGNRLIEPFLGSAAVFLNTDYDEYLLSDSNADLINLYQHLADEGLDFISYAKSFFVPENNTQERFYELRESFNTTNDSRLKSALFVYLNRHCFNGLCRYNSKGGFNVPFGKYSKPPFPEAEMIGFVDKVKSAKVEFRLADFKAVMSEAKAGDIIYCDPPYVPLTDTANFTDYSAGGFSMKDQQDLADLARELRDKGIPVIISNHNTPWTQANYTPARLIDFEVQRFISATASNRGKAAEILAVF